jgi:4-diphosphocytidyl-2-C-methyl-D-erythritol kinase
MLTPLELDLSRYSWLLVYPGIHVNTGWAFGQITPRVPERQLQQSILQPVEEWKHLVSNDFEAPVFSAHPVLGEIKAQLYEAGALYATMSGSGSAMVGIFPKNKITGALWDAGYRVFKIS